MADVVVTVNIDGKQAYVLGAGGAVDGNAFAASALQAAADHFKSVIASRMPAQMSLGETYQDRLKQAQAAQQAKDNSL